ncbi:hypothetical protein BY996DRAFT_3489263 [Phakopsora pachyrhizi]|nr:hypothetical protein BY996DRAFT_3489263 [Phakopsora pachyrhizi]
MRKESILTQKHQEDSSKSPVSAGWLGWFWSGGQETSKNSEETWPNNGVLGEEEREQLYGPIDLPSEAILFSIQTKLNKGSFTLRSGKEENFPGTTANAFPHNIMSLIFEGFLLNTIQRTDNSELSLKLAGFCVSDGTVKATKHCQIVRVKAGQSRSITRRNSKNFGSSSAHLMNADFIQVAKSNTYFKFEHKPLDGHVDNAITLKMRHTEIAYHPGYV